MAECVFCAIASGEIPSNKVYEDEEVLAFLDNNPAARGHTLVIPKKHYQDMTRAPKAVVSHIYQVAQLIAQACLTQLGATGVNVLTNIGRSAGQSVFHFHVHVVPRYQNDSLGVLFDKPLGLPTDQLPLLADKIKQGIE